MSIIDELKKLTSKDVLLFFTIALGVVCPGVFWLWIFEKGLLENSSAPKLLILAGTIGLPAAVIATAITGIVTGKKSEHSNNLLVQFLTGCLASAAACILPITIVIRGLPPTQAWSSYLLMLVAASLVAGLLLRRDKETISSIPAEGPRPQTRLRRRSRRNTTNN